MGFFLIITLIKIPIGLQPKNIKLPAQFKKYFIAIVVLVLIATAVRIPFLIHNFGLLDADDALPILTAKHISEGKIPPVYHYGQYRFGTLCYHIYALVFKLFGFSILSALLTSVFLYLAFIVAQFFFFEEIFSSFSLAFVLALFYCLPFGHLFAVSFHLGTSFPLVLLGSSVSLYIAYLIYAKDNEKLVPYLGLCIGLLYWIHPSTIAVALTSFVLIALRFKLKWKKYLKFLIYGAVGGFPIILSEIAYKFVTTKYIFLGRKDNFIDWEKTKSTISNIINLVSSKENFLNSIYIFFFLAGIVVTFYLNFKKKKFVPANVFLIFFFVFLIIFLPSRFSHSALFRMRYLYPLYFVFPVFLVGAIIPLKSKAKYVLIILSFLIIMFFSNLSVTRENYSLVRAAHSHLRKIIDVVEKTDEKYWAGDFWQVNLLTALSGEKIIGWPYSHEDYLPYKLMYFNQGENNNFIFFYEPGSFAVKFREMYQHIAGNIKRNFDQSVKFVKLIERWGIEADKKKVGDNCWLVYNISGQFFPSAVLNPIPQRFPTPELSKVECSKGFLFISLKNESLSEKYPLRIHIEIPGYCAVMRGFNSNQEEIRLNLPFPPQKSFTIKYYVDFRGLKIPSTEREFVYTLTDQQLEAGRRNIVYLSGFGPWRKIFGEKRKICEKSANLEINNLMNKDSHVRLHLYSPFGFSHPFWYGDYSQEVKIEINGNPLLDKRLEEGENIVEFDLKDVEVHKDHNVIKMEFKYHLPFEFSPLRKTAVLFDKIEIE